MRVYRKSGTGTLRSYACLILTCIGSGTLGTVEAAAVGNGSGNVFGAAAAAAAADNAAAGMVGCIADIPVYNSEYTDSHIEHQHAGRKHCCGICIYMVYDAVYDTAYSICYNDYNGRGRN